MKTTIPLILALWSVAMPMAQAAPLTVAVYDFKGEAGAAGYGANVTTLVTADLATEANLVMLERAELTKALNEQAFGISGMVSSDAAAKIGQITGAKVLVAGQVMKTGGDHLVIVADIIGTETGRLYADKVEGAADNLSDLTSNLSRKIAQTISDQATNLVLASQESAADRLARVINNLSGTNRPSISISIMRTRFGKELDEATAEGELGSILLKAGFPVVDSHSDRKPDVEITGGGSTVAQSQRGELYSSVYSLDVKIQARRSGDIIGFDRQESTATDVGETAAVKAAEVKAVDELAERLLPLLAK
jgi:TolB-like protein